MRKFQVGNWICDDCKHENMKKNYKCFKCKKEKNSNCSKVDKKERERDFKKEYNIGDQYKRDICTYVSMDEEGFDRDYNNIINCSNWTGILYYCKEEKGYDYKQHTFDINNQNRKKCPKILLILREDGLAVPGGRKEKDESFDKASIREIKEEILKTELSKENNPQWFDTFDFEIRLKVLIDKYHFAYCRFKELSREQFDILFNKVNDPNEENLEYEEILACCSIPIYFTDHERYKDFSDVLSDRCAKFKHNCNQLVILYGLLKSGILSMEDITKFWPESNKNAWVQNIKYFQNKK
eukprot:TRINITY_DN8013_c0_g1_i1.p1 TRINITY_DN8013_c0_g1~~TRINITY_DN8013_c0_g1_i1.p1  ORF type:complete len:296 (+),score=57.36 TRINITY_DN8013_c0_g1_i1:61-948(+)